MVWFSVSYTGRKPRAGVIYPHGWRKKPCPRGTGPHGAGDETRRLRGSGVRRSDSMVWARKMTVRSRGSSARQGDRTAAGKEKNRAAK